MATLTAHVQLPPTAAPDDRLRLVVVSVAGVTLDAATDGQKVTAERVVGDVDLAEPVLIAATVELDRCGIHEWGVSLIDVAGNESPLWRSFDELADHPDGNTAHVVSATGNPNEADLSWVGFFEI